MKYLALIPARGGSKRLPRKNILSLGGKPLIAWTLFLAKQLGSNVEVLVSTDDVEIAHVAQLNGVPVPWMRPLELSGDKSSTVDVALHALDLYERMNGPVDGLILLQPTCPFRKLEFVIDGMKLFENSNKAAIIGVVGAASHPGWCFKIDGGLMVPYLPDALSLRSQDLPAAVEISGALYIIEPTVLRKSKTFFPDGAIPIMSTNEIEALDIDTPLDFLYAEKIVESGLV